ncbi:MAG: 1,4-alpha-glucan branching protein GlgB [Elusimicrobia bacterium]|nr:1,4-alpha-glucan branching protein GlgB [Elusimicrobiota bacterium]
MAQIRSRKRLLPNCPTLLSEDDLHFFNEGTQFRLYDKLGAHLAHDKDGVEGVYFAVWAPNARKVSVIGDFNGWNRDSRRLHPKGPSGIWEGFIPGVGQGTNYKYFIHSNHHGYRIEKADPLAFHTEIPPKTASVVWDISYEWADREWMAKRGDRNGMRAPVSIYEIHLGSWMRVPEEGGRSLNYRELATKLVEYVKRMGFTHVEFLPVMEHPFGGSWGYQTTGYFAPTSRFGTPQDFMFLIDRLHQNGIGVFLDWVPSHFPTDAHGLGFFDGTHLYEHQDSREGFHPDWASFIFNYGRHEVRSFLISSALFWLDKYHVDGLRVDAVASMLYRDYSRKSGEWIPNRYGGRENIEAIDILRRMNEEAYKNHPGIQMIAEESTSWGGVSRPTYVGGLGFGYKWDMGWMHDTLVYMKKDGIHRKYHHNQLTFRMLYAWHENFILPLSHDEIVHGKCSLITQMSGCDDWQKFANLRALFLNQWTQPGKKLLFMGGEIAQRDEWWHEKSLDWHLLQWEPHQGVQRLVADLNRLYRETPPLHELDTEQAGFEWVDCSDCDASVLTYLRYDKDRGRPVLVALNYTSVPRAGYRVGVPRGGYWRELLNSDARDYWGGGIGNGGGVWASEEPSHGRPCSLWLTIPPLGGVILRPD